MSSRNLATLVALFVTFVFVLSLTKRDEFVWKISHVEANWPNGPPFIDRCTGSKANRCRINRGLMQPCVWSEASYPECFNRKFLNNVPPVRSRSSIDIVTRFFEFSYGVHLSEGSIQRWHYNIDLEACARLCLRSAGDSRIRCLSFDFYPFEYPISEAPNNESPTRGMCILNSSNKDSARLRNEDQGRTDAEFFYTSHFSFRPFSALDGYYEIRDPRGGQIAKMLDYDGLEEIVLPADVDDARQVQPLNVWPKTRWGVFHFKLPPPLFGEFVCTPDGGVIPIDDDGEFILPEIRVGGNFSAGFTPVNDVQSCPGRLTKDEASTMCVELGGSLCSRGELNDLVGRQIGCGYDGYPIWAKDDQPNGRKFVRCCVEYGILDSCDLYSQENIDYCSSITREHECVDQGSASSLHAEKGRGRWLEEIRNKCSDGTGPCSGMVRDWQSRDRCIWCLNSDGDSGSCFAGNDYGICPSAARDSQILFELRMKSACERETVCRTVSAFPHLSTRFEVPTRSPTRFPTTSPSPSPTKFPTLSPTKSPSVSPTFSPSPSPTISPTLSPSLSPTRFPTTSPSPSPTRFPTTSPSPSPTRFPTTSPSPAPTLYPTTSPTPAPTSYPTSSPTDSPTDHMIDPLP